MSEPKVPGTNPKTLLNKASCKWEVRWCAIKPIRLSLAKDFVCADPKTKAQDIPAAPAPTINTSNITLLL